jgi:hypothetical protein
MGGSKALDVPSNLIATCFTCNHLKEDSTGATRRELEIRGIRLRNRGWPEDTIAHAEATQVGYPDGSWWLLDRAGGRSAASPPST